MATKRAHNQPVSPKSAFRKLVGLVYAHLFDPLRSISCASRALSSHPISEQENVNKNKCALETLTTCHFSRIGEILFNSDLKTKTYRIFIHDIWDVVNLILQSHAASRYPFQKRNTTKHFASRTAAHNLKTTHDIWVW